MLNEVLDTFYLLNIQGLYPKSNQTKLGYLSDLTAQNNPLFLAITETHLKEEYDAEISIDNYTILRSDRSTRKGGGVALFIRSDVLYDHARTVRFSDAVNELLITTLVNEKLIIILLYRPPDEIENNPLKFNIIFNMIKDYVKDRQEDVLLMGDFIFSKIIWETSTLGGRTANEKAQGEILLNFISE